jgi:hypothetical protein
MFSHGLANKTIERDQVFIFEQQRIDIFPSVVRKDSILFYFGGVYSIQHYVIKFVSDLRLVCGFLRVLRFPPTITLTAKI